MYYFSLLKYKKLEEKLLAFLTHIRSALEVYENATIGEKTLSCLELFLRELIVPNCQQR